MGGDLRFENPFNGFLALLQVKMELIGGRPANWQRYEEATMCQRRPADPTDPGDAADLSIMGYF